MWKRTKIQKQGHNLVQHSTEWDTERQCTLDQEERCPRLGQIEISMHKWEIKKKGVSPQSPINDKRQNYWKTNKDIKRSRLIYHHCWFDINPNQDGHCRGCSRVGCQNTPPPSLKSVTHPTTMKLGTVIPYLEKIQKIYESRDTASELCWHQHFFTGNQ